jgi:hypothetical protein
MKQMRPCDHHTATEWSDWRMAMMAVAFFAVWLHVPPGWAQESAHVEPVLGPAPTAPRDLSSLPGNGLRKLDAQTAGFSVNGQSREQVRQFYNAVYTASEGIPIDSTANTASCIAGANSAAFQTAVLWRINWFRAMGGIPAGVTFSTSECVEDQAAALMMSANNQLLHEGIPASWSCYTTSGATAAVDSNLALGLDGPDAITGYIWDYGAANAAVGHRRWLLYPQTQVMATGDVPAEATFAQANATWVIDSNYGGPRPETTEPYVAWPPPGYVPYAVVYPQWSFALSNADLSDATVVMLSNGVPLSVTLQPYNLNYGEDTLVWYPSALDPSSASTIFPFNGADTIYGITITNVRTIAGPQSFNYNVTVFDPAVPGADYVPTIISGTNRPSLNENNPYACNPSANPNTTGYQWVAAQSTNGDLADKSLDGLINFTISPSPIYSVITNPPVGTGKCFHLTHTNPVPQLLQFAEVLFPATNTTLSFQSLLGYATTNQVARVQVSTNDGAWIDLYTQTGTGGAGQGAFAPHTLSLSNCAGRITWVRFDYDYAGGSYFPSAAPNVGWCLEDIVMTNASQLIDFATNATVSTNLNFVPGATGKWVLEARAVIFNQFGLDWSPTAELTVVTNAAPTLIFLGSPAIAAGQAQIPFVLTQGAASSFNLLQASQLTETWTTNASAVLTNLGGISFQFTAPFAGETVFYRIRAR